MRTLTASATGDIEVVVKGGTYSLSAPVTFGPQDSGRDATHRVLWRAAAEETPVLSGATPVTNWTAGATVGGHQIWYAKAPESVTETRDLTVNGAPAVRARSDYQPNFTYDSTDNTIGRFTTPTTASSISSWKDKSAVEAVFHSTFITNRCTVGQVTKDTAAGKDVVTFADPCWYYSEWSGDFDRHSQVVNQLENAYELLDRPGEWYFDQNKVVNATEQRFYYIPRDGETMTGTDAAAVTVPQTQALLQVAGTNQTGVVERVKHLVFEGLTFADTTWKTPEYQGMSGTADDTSTQITYSGAWIGSTGVNGQYRRTQHYTQTNGASFSYSFTGTGVSFISTQDSHRGKFTYKIDNADAKESTCASTKTVYLQPCLTVVGLAPGSHTITITKVDGDFLSLDLMRAVTEGPAADDVTTSEISYNGSANGGAGNWTAQTGVAGQYAGTQHYTETNGDRFTSTFTGTGVSFVSQRASNRGSFSYSVDGGPTGSGTCESADAIAQTPCLTVAGLAPGTHTITVTKTGGQYLSVDLMRPIILPTTGTQGGFVQIQANVMITGETQICDLSNFVTMSAAVEFSRVSDITFAKNTITRVGQTALKVDRSSNNVTIVGNEIHDVAGSGIHVGGVSLTDQRPADTADRMHDITITNNYVHDIGTVYNSAVGIVAGYVDTLTISHNEIADIPYSGVSVGWGWGFQDSDGGIFGNGTNCPDRAELDTYPTGPTAAKNTTVSSNYIHDYMKLGMDGGGVYSLGAQPNSTITGNHIAHTGNYQGHQKGFYLDNGTHGYSVSNNVLEDLTVPMLLNYGGGIAASAYNTDDGGNTTDPTTTAAKAIIASAGLEPAYQYLSDESTSSNAALGATATTEHAAAGMGGANAIDGRAQTRWETPAGDTADYLEVTLPSPTWVDGVTFKESQYLGLSRYGRINTYTLEYKNGTSGWTHLAAGIYPKVVQEIPFAKVQATAFRLTITASGNAGIDEFEIDGGVNYALDATASQSSTYSTAQASRAVDGLTNGDYGAGSVTHTGNDVNAWWQVDLGASRALTVIEVFNRTELVPERLSDYWVFVSDTPFNTGLTPSQQANTSGVWSQHLTTQAGTPTIVPAPATGRYIMVQLNGTGYLSLAEVRAY
ncbi:discoidin domain-containing protein [Microbacterium sulfonylureivorans]|uniref:galactose-binding domain-containing protein n=1 Tax=Microbacterium sulfonylureivorans TaxID=2486854 RepID=UPI0013DF5BBF|nr:discoidin domain-containing protein [Microbacterium sulfonylureivorans]